MSQWVSESVSQSMKEGKNALETQRVLKQSLDYSCFVSVTRYT